MIIYPEVIIITVHDSIVFAKVHREKIEKIFDNELSNEFDLI
jgi:hypothetical protein